jgi:hypothetical protein
MTTTGIAGVSMPTARPLMMLVAGPVSEAFTIDCTGPVLRLGVVLRDPDEEERRDEPTTPQPAAR